MSDDWRGQGACYGSDPKLFFPEQGDDTRPAKAICRGCAVRLECLEFALEGGEKFGVWGGLSERERRRIRRDRRQAGRRPMIRPTAQDNGCGTYAGYRAHLRRGEETCVECRRANAYRQSDEKAARSA